MRKRHVTKEEFNTLLKPLARAKVTGTQFKVATNRGGLVYDFVKKAETWADYKALNAERSQRLAKAGFETDVEHRQEQDFDQAKVFSSIDAIQGQLQYIIDNMLFRG